MQAGKLLPHRTAAECIDFDLPAASIFDRKKPLATNTQRRVAKGLWRHVLATANPFIVSRSANDETTTPYLINTRNGERQGQQPRVRTVEQPYWTATGLGSQGAVAAGFLTKFNTGSVGCSLTSPHPTVTAGGTPKRPSTGITQGLVAAHLVDMGHGEGACGTKRFSHGVRDVRIPLGTCTASNPPGALVTACLEQANGGFYDGDGRPVDAPARIRV